MPKYNIVSPENPDWFVRRVNSQQAVVRAKLRLDVETGNVDYEFRMYYLYQGKLYETTFATWEQKSGGLPGTATTYFNFRQPSHITLPAAAEFVTNFWQGVHNTLWMYDAETITIDNKGPNGSYRVLEGEEKNLVLSSLLRGLVNELRLLLHMSDNDMHKHCYQYAKQVAESCLANL
ncbi:MAG: hypothetical protein JNN11_03590 [Candidatus Doudnabacteria bacterium]|nr:hypothetical protein [Candidatus Doudnabacteria bacterium]